MEYQIKQISYYAENILEHLTTGTVHSVYRRTINLTDGRQILSLQTAHSPLSPISLISGLTAENFELLSVKPGDTVHFQKDRLLISNPNAECAPHLFLCKGLERYDLKLSKTLDARTIPALSASIQEAIAQAETGGFSLLFNNSVDSLSLILLTARNCITHCSELLPAGRYHEAASELARLLGLGCGLTPSGDDFLCGVLAGCCFSGNTAHPFTKHLKDMVEKKLSDTIDISAAFLSCALKSQFSLPIVSLYELPAPNEILTSFSAVGHSSGIDTLCGILWSLVHIS